MQTMETGWNAMAENLQPNEISENPSAADEDRQTGGEPALFADEQLHSLLTAVCAGDADAFETLYHRYQPMLGHLAAKYHAACCADQPEEREELMEEACIALYRAAVTYRQGMHSTFGLYAKICIRNRLISYLRQYKVRGMELPMRQLSDVESAVTMHGPEEQLVSEETFRALMRDVKQKLSPLEYAVFHRYLSGMSYQQIADALGITEKAADNALCRIRKKVKSCLP